MTTAQMPHESVAAEVRAVLARKRISGRRAATELGWKTGYMHRRLSGIAPFDVNDLHALSKLLDVQVTAFFAGFDLDQSSEGPFLRGGSNTQKYWTPASSDELERASSRTTNFRRPDPAVSAVAA